MYISRIHVKRGPELLRLTRTDIRDSVYATHQLLWKAFPRDLEANRDFLFRQEDREGLPCFFVVSKRRPINHELFQIDTKDYAPQLRAGQRLAFSLTANPVIARKKEGRENSEKHDVWMDAKREAQAMGFTADEQVTHCQQRVRQWLLDRAETLGFLIENQDITIDGYFQYQLYRRKGRPIRFSSMNFDGILTVADPDRFLRTLFEGVGRSRAFGCGLMLVRRVQRQ